MSKSKTTPAADIAADTTVNVDAETEDTSKEPASSGTGNLVMAYIDLLVPGVKIPADIYDSDVRRKLARAGTVLDSVQIETIIKLNDRRRTIYVTKRTFKELQRANLNFDFVSRIENENTTGYTKCKDAVSTLLVEFTTTKSASVESTKEVSDEISDRLNNIPHPTVLELINALAPVDEYLERHCVNVGMLNGLMGKWLGLSQEEIDELVLIGLLHDCGKALTPPRVLNAPRGLTEVETEVMKMHPSYSYDLLSEFPEIVRFCAKCHHEKVAGTGYPSAISGEQLPLAARITAISDIYDALISRRAYKTPKTPFVAMAIMSSQKGNELDPGLVDLFFEKMSQQLVGKPVTMSDGRVGVVNFVDPKDPEFPIIDLDHLVFKTNSDLYCKEMFTDDEDDE